MSPFGASGEQFVEPDFFGGTEVDELWCDLTRSDPMLFEIQATATRLSFSSACEPQLTAPGLQAVEATTPPWAGPFGDEPDFTAPQLGFGPEVEPTTPTFPLALSL
jgi:hypothetical protein